MPTITYNFDTPSNYSYNNLEIEVSGSKSKLLLGISSLSFNEDFANDVGFIYDNTLVEFVAGLMQQKDRTPLNSVFGASYTSSFDLDWNKGAQGITATLNGLPTLVAGKLVCTGSQGVFYLKNTAAIETYKFKYTPNYTGSPPSNVNLILSSNGNNVNDRVSLTNSPSGDNFRILVSDSAGATIWSVIAIGPAWAPISGTEYEIELVINPVTGTANLFVDGILFGTQTATPWTRSTDVHQYSIGASTAIYNVAAGSFDDYIVFDDEQHTGDYTPGYTVDTQYGASDVILPIFAHQQLGFLVQLITFGVIEFGTPLHQVSIDSGTYQYWNGSAWVDSDGSYAQSNSASVFNTNFIALDVSNKSTVSIKALFEDNNTQGSMDGLTIGYNGNTIYPTSNPTINPITSVLQDDITAFSAVVNELGGDNIHVIFEITAQKKYWDGLAWVDSDGSYAQSNTIVDAQNNITSLDSTGTLILYFFISSSAGLTTPDIDSASVTYSAFGGGPTPENVTTVFGYIYDANNNPLVAEIVTATPQILGLTNAKQIKTNTISAVTNAAGYWELELVETATSSEQFAYVFSISSQTFLKRVPIAISIAFNLLVDAT